MIAQNFCWLRDAPRHRGTRIIRTAISPLKRNEDEEEEEEEEGVKVKGLMRVAKVLAASIFRILLAFTIVL